ncbi:SAM-dependent methyltransferase [Parabacteroides acidifaciens]|uniref:SAM-dependent methyltransferase n=1 Tax=Parabacteroides acidifaciens TaxID=2290935 RepID=A0A3D8HBG1_9BACT|nr:class I SAM-dependent methyltransferase [Parabacteroides acidifaciens]MBC8603387.1 SAM-dependent methyltransferase [Parabacteroides acidifaciens]RDU47887.1 SAM-dependent methyltransferase [Parabacteroides acidifaciens]
MTLTSSQIQFIQEHAADDLTRLLLSASKYPEIDMPFVVDQIAARRQIREKLPSWYGNAQLVFPAKIAAEQCSSEQTAAYKQRLADEDWTMCDLTGGLGIDSYFFSRKVNHLTYIERFPAYCEAARHNFSVLGADNITVVNADTTHYIDKLPVVDAFYIDPARRGESNKRVFALQDCEPDLPGLLPDLLKRSPRVIAKLSPMADIQMTLDLLPGTTAVHVLSVRNECKELLFVVEREVEDTIPVIHCVNFAPDGTESSFSFTLEEERCAGLQPTGQVFGYLYEPNASVLKAGAFKQIALRMEVKKLHISSHLYTSEQLVADFPGRIFRVDEVFPFTGKLCKNLSKLIPQANITVRNFPLSVEELRKRTKITDGGSIYLFATTLANGEKILVRGTRLFGSDLRN